MPPKLKLYNTLTRKKEIFKPIKKNSVGMYCCGPTVYYYAHVGNLRTFISEDILRRVLEFNGFKVKHVMNLTDVGHLISDQDEGEDKIEKEAKKEKTTPKKIAEKYTKFFFNDTGKLNILMPHVVCKATDHIQDMIDLIKKIEKNRYTYQGKNSNIYFNTEKFKDYGKLACLDLGGQKAGARIKIDKNKKNPRDFVLWFSTKGSKYKGHVLKWPSPWGEGWPGWHIECSAMSIKYLGEQFDIHCGGVDLIPVHHTNEIAQAETATKKKPWVKYWYHLGWLLFGKNKMSKSTGKIQTLTELEKKGFDPLAFRYLCLTAHPRSELNFTLENLKSAQNSLENLRKKVLGFKKEFLKNSNSDKTQEKSLSKKNKSIINKKSFISKEKSNLTSSNYREKFLNVINDDLNTPKALSILWEVAKDNNLLNSQKYELIIEFDKILGLELSEVKEEKIKIPKKIKELAEKRLKLRKEKNWGEADKLRNQIKSLGWEIRDIKKSYELEKKK